MAADSIAVRMDGAAAPRTIALVADRSTEARTALETVIKRSDPHATVISTASGHDVIEAFTKVSPRNRPTISFVSVQLDGMTGPEAVAMVKASGHEIPSLVLVSGRVVNKWAEVAQHLEAYEFLKSPLDPDHIEQLMAADRRRRQPTRILLVESSEHGRALIRRVLALSGFSLEVEETDNALHGLKLLRMSPFDLVLVDMALQGIDGLEFACQAQDLATGTPLMLMASGDIEALAVGARHFGVAFVLKKPFYARDIDLAMHHVLGLRRPYLLNAIVAQSPGTVVRVTPAEASAASRA